MSRKPDAEPREPASPRFDHLPVLTAYTARDREGTHVIDACNDRFRSRLGWDRSAVLGRPLDRLYNDAGVPEPATAGADGGEPRSDGGDSVPAAGSTSHLDPGERPESDGVPRQSAAVERDLVAADGHLVHTVAESVPRRDRDGYVVCHVDVTRRERRERQVAALNRLLRHNVRNDLNLLRGHARTLRDHDDEAVVTAGRVIDRIADRWLGLAETGREIDHLSAGAAARTVAVDDLLSAVRAAVERGDAGGRIETAIRGVDPDAAVSEQWYAPVVELCENGLKHATAADRPVVAVTVDSADRPGWIAVAVADEGPGLPAAERVALNGGDETPLRHGSGLGLWLVRFVVEQFGGRVAVADRDPTGTVVTLTVPVACEG